MNVQLVDVNDLVLAQFPLATLGGIPGIGAQIVFTLNENSVTMTVQSVLWNPGKGIIRIEVA